MIRFDSFLIRIILFLIVHSPQALAGWQLGELIFSRVQYSFVGVSTLLDRSHSLNMLETVRQNQRGLLGIES
jgi:hypothetical protein